MKILHITPSGFKKNISGIYESVLCKKLKYMSIDIEVISLFGDRANNNYVKTPNVLKMAQDFVSPFLFKAMLDADFDILHLHSVLWSTFPLQSQSINKLFLKKPTVVTTHSFYPRYQKSFINSVKYALHNKDFAHLLYGTRCLVFKSADAIICLSTLEKEYMKKEYNIRDDIIHVIPNSVELSRFDNFYDFKQRRFIKFKNLLLYVGQLIEIKGLEYLLMSFKKIINSGYDCGLLIITYTRDKKYFDHLIKKLIPHYMIDNIILIDYYSENLSDLDLVSAYFAADIFVLPSLAESCPTVVLEAYASRKPVVASKVGGLSEIVENMKTGMLCQPKDVNALFENIKILLDDSELRNKFGNKGFEKIRKEFNWDVNVHKIVDLYNKLGK